MHDIDCHIIVLPDHTNRKWLAALVKQLKTLPLNLHFIEGKLGDIGAGRVNGFLAGSAPFKAYIDPDDLMVGNPYDQLLEVAQANLDVPCVYGREVWMHENGHVFHAPTDEFYRQRIDTVDEIDLCHHTVVYNMELIKPYLRVMRRWKGIYTEGFFKTFLWKHYKFKYVDVVGYAYRVHPNSSVTHGAFKKYAPGLSRREGMDYRQARNNMRRRLKSQGQTNGIR